MTLLAIPLGFTYDDLEKKAAENLAGVLTTLFIMYAICCLAGSWMHPVPFLPLSITAWTL